MSALTLPPDVDTLRRLVRGELKRDERIQVDMWLGRCVDPSMPVVLENLILEWEQERADASLPAGLAALSRHFARVVELGRAVIDFVLPPVTEAAAALLSPPLRAQGEGLELNTTTDGRGIAIVANLRPDVARLVVVATNDRGDLHVLHDEVIIPGGSARVPLHADYSVDPDEGRVTFWMIASAASVTFPPVPSAPEELTEWLKSVEQDASTRVCAHRITGAALSDEE